MACEASILSRGKLPSLLSFVWQLELIKVIFHNPKLIRTAFLSFEQTVVKRVPTNDK